MVKTTRELPQFVRDLLASPPPRGEGLNRWLFRVARVLHPYRTRGEIVETLQAATAGEAVKRGEIERAVERSAAVAWRRGRPACERSWPVWPKVNAEQREAIVAGIGVALVDLWELSPLRFDDNHSHTEAVIDALFPGNPLLCCGKSSADFDTKAREGWRGTLSEQQFIVPSPMTERIGVTQDGKESCHTLSNTGRRRFLVIEQDLGSLDEQAALLLHLAERAPMALAVHSGRKSLHGWFFCATQNEGRLQTFMHYAVTLGADRATWTRSQFVRMPDGTREGGKRQTVFFFNPGVLKP